MINFLWDALTTDEIQFTLNNIKLEASQKQFKSRFSAMRSEFDGIWNRNSYASD